MRVKDARLHRVLLPHGLGQVGVVESLPAMLHRRCFRTLRSRLCFCCLDACSTRRLCLPPRLICVVLRASLLRDAVVHVLARVVGGEHALLVSHHFFSLAERQAGEIGGEGVRRAGALTELASRLQLQPVEEPGCGAPARSPSGDRSAGALMITEEVGS